MTREDQRVADFLSVRRCCKPGILLLSLLQFAGCAALPANGPTISQLVAGTQSANNPLNLHIVPLDTQTMGVLGAENSAPLAIFQSDSDTTTNDLIGIGDTLSIAIFEAGNSLFSPTSVPLTQAQTAGPTGAVSEINLPPEQVDDRGLVNVPYAGLVKASGLTPDTLGQRIEAALAGQSQNPQVIVTITKPLSDSVIVSGGVRNSGRFPLSLAQERLLDIIAIAGGPVHDDQDVYVTLDRGGQAATILLSALESDPSQNVYLQPGDRVSLAYNPRSFTVFGAAEKDQQVKFGTPRLSLAEALAQSGGPSDGQADPDGIFIFRFEDRLTAARLGVAPAAATSTATVPVIYQLDMMQPASYFYAQQFAMRDHDLLYIANAKSNRLAKLFNLVGSLVSPAGTVDNLAR